MNTRRGEHRAPERKRGQGKNSRNVRTAKTNKLQGKNDTVKPRQDAKSSASSLALQIRQANEGNWEPKKLTQDTYKKTQDCAGEQLLVGRRAESCRKNKGKRRNERNLAVPALRKALILAKKGPTSSGGTRKEQIKRSRLHQCTTTRKKKIRSRLTDQKEI